MSEVKKPNITYLLGAGASAFAVPTVKHFPVLLDLFHSEFRQIIEDSDLTHLDKDTAFSYFKDIEEIGSFATIDTWARKLFLRKSQQYEDIKKIISLFLIYCQFGKSTSIIDKFNDKAWVSKYGLYFTQPEMDNFSNMVKRSLDPRYDLFLGSILKNNEGKALEFPQNVSVLSWNYDSQFETSINSFSDSKIKKAGGSAEILKLNGSANFNMHDGGKTELAFNFFTNVEKNWNYKSRIVDILSSKLSPFKTFENKLKFAWEMDNDVVSDANLVILDTDILVVIGYTFPSFNQEIERKIFDGQKRISNIYYQVPEGEYDGLIDRLKGTLYGGIENPTYETGNGKAHVKFKHIKDLTQFYIPNVFYT